MKHIQKGCLAANNLKDLQIASQHYPYYRGLLYADENMINISVLSSCAEVCKLWVHWSVDEGSDCSFIVQTLHLLTPVRFKLDLVFWSKLANGLGLGIAAEAD